MRFKILSVAVLLTVSVSYAQPNETPKTMAATYDSLADAILALKHTEERFVRALLDGHLRAAQASMKKKDYEGAAAQIALFANEGDNTIGGVRKRLLEGGHHHNAAGEAKGIFEPGFVIVTREAKKKALAASVALRRATTDEERTKAWQEFMTLADSLSKSD